MAETNVLDLTQAIGDCGRFQTTLAVAINSAVALAAAGMVFMSFGIYNPGWSCLDDTFIHNVTSASFQEAGGHEPTPSSLLVSVNKVPNVTVWTLDCDVKRSCQNFIYNPESSTIVTEWDLSCDRAWVSSLIISIQMCGVLIGAGLSGQIGDRFGRKICLYAYIALHCVGNIIAAFSVVWEMYAASAFIMGVGLGGNLACSYYYPLEFVNDWWRGVLTAFPIWNIGCVVLSVIIYIFKDWKYIHIALTVMSACVFLPVFWTPESVRWLTVRGKVSQAKDIVKRIALMNGRRCADTSIIDSIACEEKIKMAGHKYTYLDLLKIKSVRGYTIKFGFLWICIAISYYTISFGIKALSGDFYLNFFLFSIVELPGIVAIAPLVNLIGRRNSALLYYGVAAVTSFCVVIVFFATSGHVKVMSILTFALICKMCILSGWYIICVFGSELHPTVVRSLHFGYANSIARVGSILSPYLIPNNQDQLYVPYLAIGILFLIFVGILSTMPETKGKRLVDIAESNSSSTEKASNNNLA